MPVKTAKRGFVLLYAVIVTTVVLVVGVSLMNIITKQIVISSIGRNAKLAYYAAQTGKQCAEYWLSVDGNYFGRVDESGNEEEIIDLNGGTFGCPTPPTQSGSETTVLPPSGPNVKKFQIDDSENNLCSLVTVTFTPNSGLPQKVLIEAEGYNASCNNLKTANPRRVKAIYSDRVD